MQDDTRLIHHGRAGAGVGYDGLVNPPVCHASTILFPTLDALEGRTPVPMSYGRHGTPTQFALAEALSALHGGAGCVLVPSGLAAAVLAISTWARTGTHLLVTDSVYGPTRAYCDDLARHRGVTVEYFDPLIGAGIEALLRPPLYVPESVTTTQLLESFRRARLQFALIIDEYGEVQGLVTLTDVLAAIVGELSVPEAPEDRDMLQREDGSWLVDGDVGIERLKSVLDIGDDLSGEDERSFNTLGGFIMHVLGRIPAPTDHFDAAGWRFEVMDMDRNRVDKVLLSRASS